MKSVPPVESNGIRIERLPFLQETKEGTLIEVRVQPRASRSEIAGISEDRLRIRLTSAPVEGEANRQCVKLLAKVLDVSKSDLEIVKGRKSRLKTILVRKFPMESLLQILRARCVS